MLKTLDRKGAWVLCMLATLEQQTGKQNNDHAMPTIKAGHSV
jgi:hypothetical protein